MTDTTILGIALSTMIIAAKLCAPILVTSLVVGFAVSLFQSVTQIQEVTLSFVPKVVAVAIVLLITGNWMLHELVTFTTGLYEKIPMLLSSG